MRALCKAAVRGVRAGVAQQQPAAALRAAWALHSLGHFYTKSCRSLLLTVGLQVPCCSLLDMWQAL